MRINVTSTVLMARHVIPEMRKSGRGAIVNISSVSGLLGGNPGLLYPTSKAAIIQMTRAMVINLHQNPSRLTKYFADRLAIRFGRPFTMAEKTSESIA